MTARQTYYRHPSWHAAPTRRRTRLCMVKASGRHRFKAGTHAACYRCRRRTDHCREDGCLPYLQCLSGKRLRQIGSLMQTLGDAVPPRRYPSDCIDVALTLAWAKKARVQAGLDVAVLGTLMMAHVGHNLLTFGILCPALTPTIRWNKISQTAGHMYRN